MPSSEEKSAYPLSDIEQQALARFDEGVWTKIIRNDDKKDENKHNREFTEHLFHPEIRQKIRDEKGINKQGYKLLLSPHRKKSDKRKPETVYEDKHGFFSIIKADTPYQRSQHKAAKKYQDSTKHPVTFLSPDTPAGLFGYGKKRTMVGYAFTVNSDNIKFLSTQDCGTHGRWWYNEDLNCLYSMSSHTAKFVCKTFAEFQERVRQQPFAVNEALVKLNTRDLFAIVIAEDTPEARRVAIKRRLEMLYRYGKDLPIVFYNPEERQRVKIYASAEQRQDHSKLFLDCLQKRLEEKCAPKPRKISAFFVKEAVEMIEISIDFKVYSLTLENARRVLAIIKESPEKAFEFIMTTLPAMQVAKVTRCG